MDSRFSHTRDLLTGHRPLRTTTVEGTEFIAAEDVCDYLREVSTRITELTLRQQEQIATMCTALDVLCGLLGERYPELENELLSAAQVRKSPN